MAAKNAPHFADSCAWLATSLERGARVQHPSPPQPFGRNLKKPQTPSRGGQELVKAKWRVCGERGLARIA